MTAAIELEADKAAARGDYPLAVRLLEQVAPVAARVEVWTKLSAMRRASGDAKGAMAALDQALSLDPLDFIALLMRATQLFAAGKVDHAGVAYGRALAQAPDPPPSSLTPVLAVARDRHRAWQEHQADVFRKAIGSALSDVPKLERFITNTVRLTKPDREGPTHYCYPGLPEIPFLDCTRFPWLSQLEAATDAIQAEFEAVVAEKAAHLVPYIQYPDGVPIDQWRALNHNRDWTAIHLIDRGQVVEANARHCPLTLSLLCAIPQPQVAGAGPNAMFSLLAPGTHIPPHTGITNTRLVCHLPLIVPDGCWFRVGTDRRDWQQGQAWVFDDTIEHEAMNPSAALRVILIVDVWHPDLNEAERAGVAAVIGAGGQVHGL
jgi:aspartyl/asparaginyl beta-hydroxylase (cupin superfamily)